MRSSHGAIQPPPDSRNATRRRGWRSTTPPQSVFEAVELDGALPDPDRAQAADPAWIAEQFALDAKALLAVLVDDEPRPTLAEPRIYIFIPQAERLEDVAVGVHDVVGAGHRDILRRE